MSEILLITNKSDITTDFIVKQLKSTNIHFYRLNTEDIGNKIQVNFDFKNSHFTLNDTLKEVEIDLLRIKAVYFRRPEITYHNPELTDGQNNFLRGELLFILEGIYKILSQAFWISDVHAIRNAENKIFQLLLAKQIGFKLPESLISNIPEKALCFFEQNNQSCIIKPIKSGLIESNQEEGVIFTSKLDINSANSRRITDCPVYIQKLVEKEADVRVTVVGRKLFPAKIHSQENIEAIVDWRKTDTMLKYTRLKLPKDIIAKCRTLMKTLSLSFAAIDFILNEDGSFTFLEINPNGQWAWIEKQLHFKISHEITALLVKKSL